MKQTTQAALGLCIFSPLLVVNHLQSVFKHKQNTGKKKKRTEKRKLPSPTVCNEGPGVLGEHCSSSTLKCHLDLFTVKGTRLNRKLISQSAACNYKKTISDCSEAITFGCDFGTGKTCTEEILAPLAVAAVNVKNIAEYGTWEMRG